MDESCGTVHNGRWSDGMVTGWSWPGNKNERLTVLINFQFNLKKKNKDGLPVQSDNNNPSSLTPTPEQAALLELEKNNQIHYTPAKKLGNKRIVCDDDTTILRLALNNQGIIVSNDNFKRFINQNGEEFKQVIEERVLMYSFIDEKFMPVEDPLGKSGPSLDNFLRFETTLNSQYMKRCPYKKKCTYGTKCKFWHPERQSAPGQPNSQYKTAHQSVLEDADKNQIRLQIIMGQNETDSNAAAINTNNANPTTNTKTAYFNSFENLVETNKPKFDMRRMGPTSSTSNDNNNHSKMFNASKQMNWPNSFGLDALSLNETPSAKNKSFLINTDTDALLASGFINNNNNNNRFSSTLIEAKTKEDKSMRMRLMELVESGDLTLKQVDKVLEENPYETNIENLVFLASMDNDQF